MKVTHLYLSHTGSVKTLACKQETLGVSIPSKCSRLPKRVTCKMCLKKYAKTVVETSKRLRELREAATS